MSYAYEGVLDHGFVRLVDYMGSDLSIVRAARVSYDAAWRTGEDEDKDKKLMRRLWSGQPSTHPGPLPPLPKHSTPFESVTVTFEVMAPIFVFRQWHRHRTQSYNELSARYRELPAVCYVPHIDVIGKQSTGNKQGREPLTDEQQRNRHVSLLEDYNAHCGKSFLLYQELLNEGWPKELARCVLPLSTYSHMFTTMNLLNFFKFANLRCDPHAQYEIRVYAHTMLNMIAGQVAPEAASLYREANP